MLCSDCSNKILPVVAIDIDGTLGDYHGHFEQFLQGYLGTNHHTDYPYHYQGAESYSDYIIGKFECTIDTFRAAKLAYRQGAYKRTMPVLLGSKELVKEVHRIAELWITTTRPYMRVDQIDPDTQEWLRRNNMNFHGLLFHEDKYSVLADRVDKRRVIAVVDDLKENLDSASELFGAHVPIQLGTRYNIASRFTPFSTDHSEILSTIKNRIAIWEDTIHGH